MIHDFAFKIHMLTVLPSILIRFFFLSSYLFIYWISTRSRYLF